MCIHLFSVLVEQNTRKYELQREVPGPTRRDLIQLQKGIAKISPVKTRQLQLRHTALV